jgi:hypothetical protein
MRFPSDLPLEIGMVVSQLPGLPQSIEAKTMKVPVKCQIVIDEHLLSDVTIVGMRMGYFDLSDLVCTLLRKWVKAMKTSPHIAFLTFEA